MKRSVVVVALPGQEHEIVDRQRSLLREESHSEIADLGLEYRLVGFRGVDLHRRRRGPSKSSSNLLGLGRRGEGGHVGPCRGGSAPCGGHGGKGRRAQRG